MQIGRRVHWTRMNRFSRRRAIPAIVLLVQLAAAATLPTAGGPALGSSTAEVRRSERPRSGCSEEAGLRDGITALKSQALHPVPACRRGPSVSFDRVPYLQPVSLEAVPPPGSESGLQRTQPAYLNLFLPSHPHSHRAPPG